MVPDDSMVDVLEVLTHCKMIEQRIYILVVIDSDL